MTRSILAGLLGILSIAAVGALPLACQSGGIGDPCIPEDEYNADFAGFKVTEENIESRSFQCSTRICLVNHFQGRVTCPLGQGPRTPCDGAKDTRCETAKPSLGKCVEAGTYAPDCIPGEPNACPGSMACDKTRKICTCVDDAKEGYHCELSDPKDANSLRVYKSYVCHKEFNCQAAGADPVKDKDKDCCVPGTDTPTTSEVCGQCTGSSAEKSPRSGDRSVYCSCRCGVADGATDPEPNFNFCECPTGFSCEQVRPAVGLGDPLLTGKYCVKEGTKYTGKPLECGDVYGTKGATCDGLQKK